MPAEQRLAAQQAKLAEAQRTKEAVAAQLREETQPKRITVLKRRYLCRDKSVEITRQKVEKTLSQLQELLADEKVLRQRLKQFEQDNAENPQPVQACFRLDVALERFYAGKTQKHSALAHFGNTPVAIDLPAWFHHYNARQTTVVSASRLIRDSPYLQAYSLKEDKYARCRNVVSPVNLEYQTNGHLAHFL